MRYAFVSGYLRGYRAAETALHESKGRIHGSGNKPKEWNHISSLFHNPLIETHSQLAFFHISI